MAYGDNFEGVLSDYFSTSLQFNSDQVPNAPNTLDTVPVNAVQSMQPVSNDQAQSWSGFWQDMTKGVLSYGIAKDLRQSGGSSAPVTPSTPQTRQAAQQAAKASPLVLLAAGAGLVYVLTKGG